MITYDSVAGKTRLLILILGSGFGAVLVVTSILVLFILTRKRMKNTVNNKNIELFMKQHGDLAPRRYKYLELKKMTKSFNDELGQGGYGHVYKAKSTLDGRLMAVKVLNKSKNHGEEFLNEVASISRTSHVNIVTLLGFCIEGSKRALVYEFMPNGSLDKFIAGKTSFSEAEWEKLFEIAVGVARGLEYLHRGCQMQILHLDIKPHNILLDKDFNPKISDFGLAKLRPNRASITSMLGARGTVGYIAPEVFCRNYGKVSHKSDVYSYGMMVLDIVGEKGNSDPGTHDRTSELYFPHWIYKHLDQWKGERGIDDVTEDDDWRWTKRKLTIVGLWCIQTDPNDRPSMGKVVEMLEGKHESLLIPPKPYLSSPTTLLPHDSFSESSSI
ncbi:hypothetical protein ACS0TY_008370 [Phlomoides rotata]